MTKYAEIRTEFTDEDINVTSIDGWKTDDENEGGTTLAVVCRDTGKVIWFNNDERLNPQVRQVIYEVLLELKASGEVEYSMRGYHLENSLKEFGS